MKNGPVGLIIFSVVFLLYMNCENIFGPKENVTIDNGYLVAIISLDNVSDSTQAYNDAFNRAANEFNGFLAPDSATKASIEAGWINFAQETLTIQFRYPYEPQKNTDNNE